MFGNSIHVSTICPFVLSSYMIKPISCNWGLNFFPNLILRPKRKFQTVRVSSANNAENAPEASSTSENKNPLGIVVDVFKSIWSPTFRSLRDFGFGKRSIWEGGVGLFLVSSTFVLALCLIWVKGFQLSPKFKKYLAVFEFAQACGICVGTAVRIRGVDIGRVIRVNPSMRSIEAVVEVENEKVMIPRNSLVEVNQSGLLMETIIDITPCDPIPRPAVGPLHAQCDKEGLIVCDKQKIKGTEGVSLDALIGILTRLGCEVEDVSVTNTYALAVRATSIIEEARPLFTKIKDMAEDVQPLLADVRDRGLLKEVENLIKSLTQASEELRKVNSSIVTPENADLIQRSIYSLIFTLKKLEVISSDIAGFTGDEATRHKLKLLIKSLSRML